MTFWVVTSWGAELGAGGWTVKGSNEGGGRKVQGNSDAWVGDSSRIKRSRVDGMGDSGRVRRDSAEGFRDRSRVK